MLLPPCSWPPCCPSSSVPFYDVACSTVLPFFFPCPIVSDTVLLGFSFSHAVNGQFSLCACFCSVPDYIPAPRSTSSPPAVWAAVSSWASAPESEIRVRLQSVPLPPLLMLQARERAAGSPAATQIQPAKARTQAPGRQSATVCHFNPHAPMGLLKREGRREAESERGRKGERPHREKEHPEAEGSFCDMWTIISASESLTAADWLFAVSTIHRPNHGAVGLTCVLTIAKVW